MDDLRCSKKENGSFDCSKLICKVTKGTGEEIGDEITCGTESFYVVYAHTDTITMIAKYNLNVGSNRDKTKAFGIQVDGGPYLTYGSLVTSLHYENDAIAILAAYGNYLTKNVGMNADTTVGLPTFTNECNPFWCTPSGNYVKN